MNTTLSANNNGRNGGLVGMDSRLAPIIWETYFFLFVALEDRHKTPCISGRLRWTRETGQVAKREP